jgi:hypothetical protein
MPVDTLWRDHVFTIDGSLCRRETDDSREGRTAVGWLPNTRIRGQQSKASPALAAFGQRLHMVHLGNSSNDIWHSTFDGSSWSANVKIPNQLSKASPALAAFGQRLHMVHLGNSSNDIWHSTFDGSSWSANVKIPNQLSKASPALALSGDLHMVHLGNSSNDIWHSQLSVSGGTWSTNARVPNQTSKGSPALALFGDLHMVHLGNSSNDIWHSRFDPAFVPPTCDIWADTPMAIGEPGERAIVSVGHRRCSGTDSQPVQVTVRLRKHNRIWFDKTLAQSSEFGVNVDVPVRYECTGTGFQTVFAEVIERDGDRAQSQRRNITLCS